MGAARWDDWRTGCPRPTGGAASRPMCQLAWRSGCSAADRTITSSGASATDVPPREPKASDWRGGRAAASTSRGSVSSGPAPGMAGDRGGVRDGRAPSAATCEPARSPSGRRSCAAGRTKKPAIPGHGKGPQRVSAGSAGLAVLRQGWKPVRGETPVPRWLDAQRDSPARAAGRRPGPQRPGSSAMTATGRFTGGRAHRSSLGSSGPVLRNERRIRRALSRVHLDHAIGDQLGQCGLDGFIRRILAQERLQ